MRRISTALVALGILALTTPHVGAQTSRSTLSVTGVLNEISGAPVHGSKSLRVRIYSHATSTAAEHLIFEETQQVDVVKGRFTLLLGDATAGGIPKAVVAHAHLWAAISIDGQADLDGRMKLSASAYALNADLLDGFEATDFAPTNHSHPEILQNAVVRDENGVIQGDLIVAGNVISSNGSSGGDIGGVPVSQLGGGAPFLGQVEQPLGVVTQNVVRGERAWVRGAAFGTTPSVVLGGVTLAPASASGVLVAFDVPEFHPLGNQQIQVVDNTYATPRNSNSLATHITFEVDPIAGSYTHVATLNGSGQVIAGSWATLFQSMVTEARDCKVRYDNRISYSELIQVNNANSIYFDFGPLYANHASTSWDSYAYVVLENGTRAGVGARYRRGHANNVALRDEVQHGEAEFRAMNVEVFCETQNTFNLVGTFDANGNATSGGYQATFDAVSAGNTCKFRADDRIVPVPYAEFHGNQLLLDSLNLHAWHNSWETYGYARIDKGSQAALAASYRRGHANTVFQRDRQQHPESYTLPTTVQVFCRDDAVHVATINSSGQFTAGSFEAMRIAIEEQGRVCRARFDERVARVEYVERTGTSQWQLDFMNLHAQHSSWDSKAYVRIDAGSAGGLAANYRRGHANNISQLNLVQHGEASFAAQTVEILCEGPERAKSLVARFWNDGAVTPNDWDAVRTVLVEQVADCRLVHDGRTFSPMHFEYETTSTYLFDYAGLVAQHTGNGWDSYATHVVERDSSTALRATYRRGHDDLVWARDRVQHGLSGLVTPATVDLYCR